MVQRFAQRLILTRRGRYLFSQLVALFLLAVSLTSCRNCDLVEAELRTKENEIRELRAELHRLEPAGDMFPRETLPVPSAPVPVPPAVSEYARSMYGVKEVVLGRQTSGYSDSGCPEDEGVQAVIEPRDVDGHAIKAPGTVYVEVLQISPEGLKIPLSSWNVSPDSLRRTWKSGLLSTGYYVVLPWKTKPTSSRLRVVARFILPDNRVFEAERDITIHLPPEPAPSASPPSVQNIFPPVVEPLLPSPRKADPVQRRPAAPDQMSPAGAI
jgi:hypothetical protein